MALGFRRQRMSAEIDTRALVAAVGDAIVVCDIYTPIDTPPRVAFM